ncbi:MAG: autotransporter-associated beta strand repeat-containing protein [Methylobacteriaceae bacterium]|nr:autotransporter-associated beta strand repeat-containing protein [Methylobacteriaceae bacterium]
MVQLGIYSSNDISAPAQYSNWLGHAPDNVLNYLNNDSWSAFDSSVGWQVGRWQTTGLSSIWSVPLTVWGTSLEEVASGARDSHFREAAEALATAKPSSDGQIYVRLGWEFNGGWMPWAAQGHEGAFVAAFQDVVNVFRSVSSTFKFVWDVNQGGSAIDPATAYPGDAYVDVVGMDAYYNTQWNSADSGQAFQDKVAERWGLQWQQDFAAQHGKPTALSEWGVQSDASGAYIKSMAAWLADHHVLFANYWDSDDAGFSGRLDDGHLPDAAAAYLAVFGSAPTTINVDQPDPGLAWRYDQGSTITFGASHTVASAISLSGDPTFFVGANETGTLSGALADLPGGLPGELEKTGAGRLVLAGHNTYSGGTVLRDGVLELASDGAAGTGTIALTDGPATLAIDRAALDGSAHLANTIVGFGEHDVLDFRDLGGATAASFNAATHTLRLSDAAGSLLASLDLEGSFGGFVFTTSSDGHGGTMVTLDKAPPTIVPQAAAPALDTLVLRVSGDSWQGDPAFVVRVDGQQVGNLLTTAARHGAGQHEDLTLTGHFGDGPHTVSVEFVNDAFGGTAATDRNLYVAQVTLNGDTVAGESATTVGGYSGQGAANLFSNGTATFFRVGPTAGSSGAVDPGQTDHVVVTVSGDSWQGDPHFAVLVDGQKIGGTFSASASHAAGERQAITLSGSFGAGPHTVAVEFLDDAYGGSPDADRNLHVAQVVWNGHVHVGDSAAATGGYSGNGESHLFSNGAASFQIASSEHWMI